MAFHGYDPGDPNIWYQSRSVLREPATEYGGNYYSSGFLDSGYHGYSPSIPNHHFPSPHRWVSSPIPVSEMYPDLSFHHHSSPPLPHHTIINGHSLPLQFPFTSQISQPLNHQPSKPTYYSPSQPYNPFVCLPPHQSHAQPLILPTKATATPPIYDSNPLTRYLVPTTETTPKVQVTFNQFTSTSLQLEAAKVIASVDTATPCEEDTTESDFDLVAEIGKGRHGGQHYEPEIVFSTPPNMEPCFQIPDPEANDAIDDDSICCLTPSMLFPTSNAQANIVSEKTFSSRKEDAHGVCATAAEDSDTINLDLSYKVPSGIVDKSKFWDYLRKNGYKMLSMVNTNHGNCTKPPDILHKYDFFDDITTADSSKEEFLHIFITLVYDCCKLCPFEARGNFLWNMLKPNFASLITSGSPLVSIKIGKAIFPTSARIEELKLNLGRVFERMWEHWKSQLTTEIAFDDIGNTYSDRKLLLGRVSLFLSFLRFSLDLDDDVNLGIAGKLGWFLDMLVDAEIYSSFLDLLQVPVLYGCEKIVEVVWQSMISSLLNALQIFMLMVSSSPAWRELESFLLENFFHHHLLCWEIVIELGCFMAHHAKSGMMCGIAGNLCLLVKLVESSDSILVVDPAVRKRARSFRIILIFGAQSMVDQVYMAIVRDEGTQLSLVMCLAFFMEGFQFPLNLLSAAKMKIVVTQRIMTDYSVFIENFDEKSISSFDCHVFGDPIFTLSTFLFEQSFNLYKGISKLSNEMTQGQASMRLVVANLVLGLFTWLNGHLRVDLASLVHDLLVWNCMKAITHYCSQIIAGIRVGSQLHFLQMAEFWFIDDKSWNVSQTFMEFKSIIVDKDAKGQLTGPLDDRVANYMSLEIYEIVEDHMYFSKFNEQHVTFMPRLIKIIFVDNFWKSLRFGVKLEKFIDLLKMFLGLFPIWYCSAPTSSIISASINPEVNTILHDWALHICGHRLNIGKTTLVFHLPLHALEHHWSNLNSINFLLNTLVLLSICGVCGENTEVISGLLQVGQVMSLMFLDQFIANNCVFNVRALLPIHYHLNDYYVGMKDFPQLGFDGNLGIQKDFTGQEPIWSLNLQLCHGNLATVWLVLCLNQGEYSLLVIKYKPGMIRMNLKITYGRVIKFSTLNQVIVPREREENAHFLALGFSTDSQNHLNILIHVIAALYSIRMTIVGMLYIMVANALSVFCLLTNGESNSIDVLWKSQLKGYYLCTIAIQFSATIFLRPRSSFLSWTLSSGCCKYILTLAGVFVDAFPTILIKNAEYSLVVWHNIMACSFFNGDYTTQWGITLFIYFGFISLHGCFWFNSIRIAFDNIMALKMLSIICFGTFLKTIAMDLQGMRTCLMLRGWDC